MTYKLLLILIWLSGETQMLESEPLASEALCWQHATRLTMELEGDGVVTVLAACEPGNDV